MGLGVDVLLEERGVALVVDERIRRGLGGEEGVSFDALDDVSFRREDELVVGKRWGGASGVL